jgi:uncharacterized lipoprotein YddW (UPF0748 family)
VREFRGAWVASVENIDWPSTNTLSTAEQKMEMVRLLDRAAQLRLNAIILQVRPACDALYDSRLEPWSEYLTGTMGTAPEPYYDPLAFAVAEAHKRGLELHAWFNPYRARLLASKSPVSANHVSRKHPEWVRMYGRKYLWLDPGEPEVQDHSLAVIMDVVKRYDVDGIHFDDYFYPYRDVDGAGREIDFPDDPSWRRYGVKTGYNREDWRRQNVNVFVQRVYQSIKKTKPWVKFGVSPFGIWRPGTPAQIRGYDPYDKLYADSRKWLVNGWLDYFAPQLYWAIEPPAQSFPVLLKWWAEQNPKGRHIWPGMNSYNVSRKWKPEEIVNQIRITRQQPGSDGHIHWDMRKAIQQPTGLAQALAANVYTQPALVPASPWLDISIPSKPSLNASTTASGAKASWRNSGDEKAWLWVVQTKGKGEWTTEIVPGGNTSTVLTTRPSLIAVSAVDRVGNRSKPAVVELN